jgi:Uma2 family endonuclease
MVQGGMEPVGLPQRKTDRLYTYGDYRTWADEERWELIDGAAWAMSPAANRYHQALSVELGRQISNFLQGKPFRMYQAPFDVLLPESADQDDDAVTTVVQPDVVVICDRAKLTPAGCTGAPDWIVEILSPRTARKDFELKLHLYERHGVREYWIVDPGNRFVHVYLLGQDGSYPEEPGLFLAPAGLVIDLGLVFSAD